MDDSPTTDEASPTTGLRVRLLLILAMAVVIGVTVGVVRGVGDGAVALISVALAGASFLLLFQPPTEARGDRDQIAAVNFGQGGRARGEEVRLGHDAVRSAAQRPVRVQRPVGGRQGLIDVHHPEEQIERIAGRPDEVYRQKQLNL